MAAAPAPAPEEPAPQVPIAVSHVVQIAEPPQPRVTVFTCSRCQGQNDGLARFCKYCGVALAHGQPVSQGQQANPPTALAPPPAAPAPAASAPAAPAPAAPAPAAPAPAAKPLPPAAPEIVAEKTGPHPLVKASDAAAKLPSASALGVPAQLLDASPPTSDTIQTRAPDFKHDLAAAAAVAAGQVPAADLAAREAQPRPAPPLAPPAGSRPRVVPAPSPKAPIQRPTRLVVVVEDGSDGKAFELKGPVVAIGRTEGDIVLFDDPYVSPRHARLVERDGKWLVQDLHSTNGIYVRLRGRKTLESGDLILLGSQVLQFQLVSDEERQLGPANQHGTRVFGSKPMTRLARLDQRTVTGLVGDIHYVVREETILGRETGDIVFTADAFLSRRHAAIRRESSSSNGASANGASRFHIEDLDSSNGTYVAIARETALEHGDRIRIGQHLFRFESAP